MATRQVPPRHVRNLTGIIQVSLLPGYFARVKYIIIPIKYQLSYKISSDTVVELAQVINAKLKSNCLSIDLMDVDSAE